MESFKKCPLKKRPIVYNYLDDYQVNNNIQERPIDLSIKKNINYDHQSQNFALNLSSNSFYDQMVYINPKNWYNGYDQDQRSLSPTSSSFSSTSEIFRESSISPPAYTDFNNIHLRGLNQQQILKSDIKNSTQRYKPYQKKSISTKLNLIHKYSIEAEDLSIKNDIPLPALYHDFYNEKNININLNKDNRYKCQNCNKLYSTYAGYVRHQQFHCSANKITKTKEFSCKNCEKSYKSLGALKMHIRTHTLPHKCTICSKAFSRAWLLQGHSRTHTGEKPFSCQFCFRAFADRSNLRAHLQTHTDIKKYVCSICQKSFSRMSLLAKHNDNGCPGQNILYQNIH